MILWAGGGRVLTVLHKTSICCFHAVHCGSGAVCDTLGHSKEEAGALISVGLAILPPLPAEMLHFFFPLIEYCILGKKTTKKLDMN